MKTIVCALAFITACSYEPTCRDDQDISYTCSLALSGDPRLCDFQAEAIGIETHFTRSHGTAHLTISQQTMQDVECDPTNINQCGYTFVCCTGGFCELDLLESKDTNTMGGIAFVTPDLCPYDVVCVRR